MQWRNGSGLDAVLVWRENGVRIRELPLSCASNGLMRSRSRCRHREDRGPRTEDRGPTTDPCARLVQKKEGIFVTTLRQSCSPTRIRGRSSELATVRSQRLVARALRMLTAQETPKNQGFSSLFRYALYLYRVPGRFVAFVSVTSTDRAERGTPSLRSVGGYGDER